MSIRNTLIAKVKIGCKQLDLTDDREAYEAMLHNLTRKTSCSKMGIKELEKVIKHMESRGAVFINKGNKRKHKKSTDAHTRMLFGLWTELYEAGGVADPSREALRAWVKRMTKSEDHPDGVSDPEWLTTKQLNQCIEPLKQWIARIS
ncbi:gp16 family protein [Maridesulfovibrio hydrothermalis]|uniref:Mu GP16 GemA n=1 Tax=Maridesulfovibrio hydrothermalis AM13 = DSM 14728 TaxID=1121451 RepID=L0R688_9BACT|nr:regulatory protein GemA [Maridesulfovibrio hydrothermalis]CCO22208.1 Mu GP16 GemA [Maridesulfovibrio hydrothermalis AM13 = DSM 14728]